MNTERYFQVQKEVKQIENDGRLATARIVAEVCTVAVFGAIIPPVGTAVVIASGLAEGVLAVKRRGKMSKLRNEVNHVRQLMPEGERQFFK